MNREKAIKILRKISPFILPAPRDRDAIKFAIDFMENHQKPTEQDTAHEPIMTDRENKIYNMVHTWCDEQAQDIPDQNRRYLMDAIVGMIDPQQDEPSEGIEVANTDLKKAIEDVRYLQPMINSFLTMGEQDSLNTVIESAEKSEAYHQAQLKGIIERVEGLMYDYDKRVQDYKTGFQEAISEVLDILKESKGYA